MRKHIEINLGYVCNNKCDFCISYFENKVGKFVGFDKVRDNLQRHKEEGYDSVGFVGGEPTIYPNIMQAIAFAHDIGYKYINITTNGRMFSRYEFLKSLVDAGLNSINLSIHDSDEDEDLITHADGGFKQKLKAIRNLERLHKEGLFPKDRIFLVSVMHLQNHDKIGRLISMLSSEGFKNFRVNFIRPCPSTVIHQLVPTYTEINSSLQKILDFRKEKDLYISLEGFPDCILNDDVVLNNRPTDHIDDVSNGDKYFSWKDKKDDLLVKLDKCKGCRYTGCEGIWKTYIWIYGKSEFQDNNNDVK